MLFKSLKFKKIIETLDTDLKNDSAFDVHNFKVENYKNKNLKK